MSGDVASAAITAVITIVVIVGALVGVGFWLLARRRARGGTDDPLARLQRRANVLLVHVDDAVQAGEQELAFAAAQFGDAKVADFAAELAGVREQLREAFGLQQRLDDAVPDTAAERREWSGRIVHLCESAQATLERHRREFSTLRQLETTAPAALIAVRELIETTGRRKQEVSAVLAELRERFAANAFASVSDNIARADRELGAADAAADETAVRIDRGTSDAAETLRQAEEHAALAGQLLDAVVAARDELNRAQAAVTALLEEVQASTAEARRLRDDPPDASTGERLGTAVAAAEAVTTGANGDTGAADPVTTLGELRTAAVGLDTAMAELRNQQRRLDGARTALTGALAAAHSGLVTTRNYIDTRRGGVGAEARTRLAEASRLLGLAEAESDPVMALDLARSSATYSRDADALARYDLLGRSAP